MLEDFSVSSEDDLSVVLFSRCNIEWEGSWQNQCFRKTSATNVTSGISHPLRIREYSATPTTIQSIPIRGNAKDQLKLSERARERYGLSDRDKMQGQTLHKELPTC